MTEQVSLTRISCSFSIKQKHIRKKYCLQDVKTKNVKKLLPRLVVSTPLVAWRRTTSTEVFREPAWTSERRRRGSTSWSRWSPEAWPANRCPTKNLKWLRNRVSKRDQRFGNKDRNIRGFVTLKNCFLLIYWIPHHFLCESDLINFFLALELKFLFLSTFEGSSF